MHKDHPDQLIACKNGSPLLVGMSDDGVYIASEYIAFQKYTSNYVFLEDGEIIILDIKNKQEFYLNYKERLSSIEQVAVHTTPKAPFKHFMEQEIMCQPKSILRALGYGARLSGGKGCTKLGGLEAFEKDIL